MTEVQRKYLEWVGFNDYEIQEVETEIKNGEEILVFEGNQFYAWESGYNKANEWHYVKDELPPENVPLNIITFDKNKKRRLWEGEYKGGDGQWWTGYFNHYIDVPYAWKEIVLPKESE